MARGKRAKAHTDIRIARIETVTMTATEYDNAVEALAVLIARWWRQHPDTNDSDKRPDRSPVGGRASHDHPPDQAGTRIHS